MNKPQPEPPVKPVSVNGVKIYERPKGKGLAGLPPAILLILLIVLLAAGYLTYRFFVHRPLPAPVNLITSVGRIGAPTLRLT